jgi:hypothetical protein
LPLPGMGEAAARLQPAAGNVSTTAAASQAHQGRPPLLLPVMTTPYAWTCTLARRAVAARRVDSSAARRCWSSLRCVPRARGSARLQPQAAVRAATGAQDGRPTCNWPARARCTTPSSAQSTEGNRVGSLGAGQTPRVFV